MCLCFTSKRLLLCGSHPLITEPLSGLSFLSVNHFSLSHSCHSTWASTSTTPHVRAKPFSPPRCYEQFAEQAYFKRTQSQTCSLLWLTVGPPEAWNWRLCPWAHLNYSQSTTTSPVPRLFPSVCPTSPASPPLLSSGAWLWSGHVPVVAMVSCSYPNKEPEQIGLNSYMHNLSLCLSLLKTVSSLS